MHKRIVSVLKSAKKLSHVKRELIRLFETTKKENGISKIGYIAGIMYSEGPQYAKRNWQKLVEHAERLRELHSFPMFAATDVFLPEIYNNLEEWKLTFEEREARARLFWREILKSGHVTDIFMTPRWEKSKGASDEHETAKQIGIKIHYIQDTH